MLEKLKMKMLSKRMKNLEDKKQYLSQKTAYQKEKRKYWTTSKILILFLFINCSLIEIFTCYATFRMMNLADVIACFPDFTPLNSLIGAVVSEVVGFAIYSLKSLKENTKGGIIYDSVMKENKPNNNETLG